MRGSLRRIASVTRKEVRQLVRDRLTMGFAVGVPLVQLALFGYAINQDIRQVPTVLLDQSNSTVSRRLAGQLEATQTFRLLERRVASEADARELLRAGVAQAVVVIPSDFARRYYRGRGAEISVWVDATDPTLARAVQSSAGMSSHAPFRAGSPATSTVTRLGDTTQRSRETR